MMTAINQEVGVGETINHLITYSYMSFSCYIKFPIERLLLLKTTRNTFLILPYQQILIQ